METRRDGLDRGVHRSLIGMRGRIQHDRHDQHDDVGFACRGRPVLRRAKPPGVVGVRYEGRPARALRPDAIGRR